MNIDKVNAAVNEFLARENVSRPFTEIADLIALLKADPRWTDAEVAELRSHVIGELLKRIERGQ